MRQVLQIKCDEIITKPGQDTLPTIILANISRNTEISYFIAVHTEGHVRELRLGFLSIFVFVSFFQGPLVVVVIMIDSSLRVRRRKGRDEGSSSALAAM